MYRRYSQVNETGMPVSQARRNRIKNIIILILVAALATLTAVALPAMQSRSGARGLMIQRMQNEIATAVRLTTSLSRNAGASSAAILAQIRSSSIPTDLYAKVFKKYLKEISPRKTHDLTASGGDEEGDGSYDSGDDSIE